MITILRHCVASNIWVPTLKVKVAAKLCLVHNFVIWSLILKLFHRYDHHIETLCRKQHLGCYLEGQGHSMTLQQKRVQPITLFEVVFYNFLTEMITILRWCPLFGFVRGILHFTKKCYLNSQFQWSTRRDDLSMEQFYRQLYIVIIVFYLKVELIINGNKQEFMVFKERLLYCPQYNQMLVLTCALSLNVCLAFVRIISIKDFIR